VVTTSVPTLVFYRRNVNHRIQDRRNSHRRLLGHRCCGRGSLNRRDAAGIRKFCGCEAPLLGLIDQNRAGLAICVMPEAAPQPVLRLWNQAPLDGTAIQSKMRNGMEEVVGSIPTRSTNSLKS
jgi:hypothetical protein